MSLVIGSFGDQLALEAPIDDPSIAVGWGYSESKWVGGSILLAAAHHGDLSTNIVRVGQLCGAKKGHWNEKEVFPAIVKSAYSVHCLPDMPGVSSPFLRSVSWIRLIRYSWV